MCTVVNARTHFYTVYCGRPGKGKSGEFGNPFVIGTHGDRVQCIAQFRVWFRSDAAEAIRMRHLVQQRISKTDILGCFCTPLICHADVIAEYVNNNFSLDSIA